MQLRFFGSRNIEPDDPDFILCNLSKIQKKTYKQNFQFFKKVHLANFIIKNILNFFLEFYKIVIRPGNVNRKIEFAWPNMKRLFPRNDYPHIFYLFFFRQFQVLTLATFETQS